jgi:hypothetical protein
MKVYLHLIQTHTCRSPGNSNHDLVQLYHIDDHARPLRPDHKKDRNSTTSSGTPPRLESSKQETSQRSHTESKSSHFWGIRSRRCVSPFESFESPVRQSRKRIVMHIMHCMQAIQNMQTTPPLSLSGLTIKRYSVVDDKPSP